MKLQLYEILVLSFSVTFLLLSLFFIFSKFFKEEEKYEEIRILDIFDKINSIVKSFLKLAHYYSTTQHFREEYHTWIYNGPNPLDFNLLKECKEKLINKSINSYLCKLHFYLPIKIEKKFFDECKLDINEEDVMRGLHDEGNFTSYCSNAKINIFINTTQLAERIDVENLVTNNRYWYLFRNIQEWSKEAGNKFAACVCSLTHSCIGCKEVKKCYEEIFEMLKERFKDDEYVICKKSPICCYNETFFDCLWDDTCKGWSKNICHLRKDYNCSIGEPSCTYEEIITQGKVLSTTEFKCYIPISFAMETSSIFYCEDRKYFESYPSGTTPVKFKIGIFAGFNVSCSSCCMKSDCEVSKKFCNDCERGICKECKFPCPNKNCIKGYLICKNCKYEDEKIIKCEECKCETCNEACNKVNENKK